LLAGESQIGHHLRDAVRILLADQQVNILGGAGGAGIDAADPCGDGIAADDGIRDSRLVQRGGHAAEPAFDSINGHHVDSEG